MGSPVGSLLSPERAGTVNPGGKAEEGEIRKVSTELPGFFQLPDSRCSLPPSPKAYLLIFQVHDFLPNYLSSTPLSRSTMQLTSLIVTLGLGCSCRGLPCQYSALESQENSSLESSRPLHERLAHKMQPEDLKTEGA